MAPPDPGPPPRPPTPPPLPAARSPPAYPDFGGRRRMQLEVQMLNREIDFLRVELQVLEGVQPVSRCCKEVNEFVGANPDPMIPINKKRRKSCRVWKWLRSKLCFCLSSTCCSGGCLLCQERPCCSCPHRTDTCCGDCKCKCPNCSCFKVSCCRPRCSWPKLSCCRPRCCQWENLCCKLPCCCRAVTCCRPRCSCPTLSCPEYSCGCIWSCPRCTGV